jgi:hypothetical protein
MMMQMSRNSCRSRYVVCRYFFGGASTIVMAAQLNRMRFGFVRSIRATSRLERLSSLGLKLKL